jgi:predicted DNA binding CopG/RHH family protein
MSQENYMNTNKKEVHIKIDEWILNEIKKKAFSLGLTTNRYVCIVLEDHIKNNKDIGIIN